MKKFWAGVLTHMATISLYQDFHGKQGYIDLIRKNWIDASITVPFALILIVIAIYLYLK